MLVSVTLLSLAWQLYYMLWLRRTLLELEHRRCDTSRSSFDQFMSQMNFASLKRLRSNAYGVIVWTVLYCAATPWLPTGLAVTAAAVCVLLAGSTIYLYYLKHNVLDSKDVDVLSQ